MTNSTHDEAATWMDGHPDTDHPSGEMALSGKSKIAARARALAGLALASGTLAVVAYGPALSTSVSAPVQS